MDAADTWYEVPMALSTLNPPERVVELHKLGEAIIAAGLSDDDCEALELDSTSLDAALHNDPKARDAWVASKRGEASWINEYLERAKEVPPHWRRALGVAWVAEHSLIPLGLMSSGGPGLRASILLYLNGDAGTTSDIEYFIEAVAKALAAEKVDGWKIGAAAAPLSVIGWFLPPSSSWALGNWVGEKLTEVEDWILEIAIRFAEAIQLEEFDDKRVTAAARKMVEEAQFLGRQGRGRQDLRRARILLFASRELLRGGERTLEETLTLPNVEGLRLSDARLALSATGHDQVRTVDVTVPDGAERTVFIESQWIVLGQYPDEGTHTSPNDEVRLAIAKRGEHLSAWMVRRRLRPSEEKRS